MNNNNAKGRSLEDELYYYGVSDTVDSRTKSRSSMDSFQVNNDFVRSFSIADEFAHTDSYSRSSSVLPRKKSIVLNKLSSVQGFSIIRIFAYVLGAYNKIAYAVSNIKVVYLWYAVCSMIAFLTGLHIWSIMSVPNFSHPTKKDIVATFNSNLSFPLDSMLSTETNATTIDRDLFEQVETTTYTLQHGDTLSDLAIQHDINIDTLVSWNVITDARRIRIGQEIVIPNKDGIIHTVKRGESISSIAGKYGIKDSKILDDNNLSSSTIVPGNNLFISGVRMNSFELGLILGTIFLNPARGVLTSGYGYRISPITGKRHFHAAIDIAARTGVPVVSATGGVVTFISNSHPAYGKVIIINHPGGFQTLYAHLSKIYIRKGTRVRRGQRIGTVGNTGLSTGPHLHFSIKRYGRLINPLKYIRL